MDQHGITCANSPQPVSFVSSFFLPACLLLDHSTDFGSLLIKFNNMESYPPSPNSDRSPINGPSLRSPVPGGNGLSRHRSSVSSQRRPSFLQVPIPQRRPSGTQPTGFPGLAEEDQPPVPEEAPKPVLGFLPPPEDRASLSKLRRRKAMSKKAMMSLTAG